jgi:hypothetical protein
MHCMRQESWEVQFDKGAANFLEGPTYGLDVQIIRPSCCDLQHGSKMRTVLGGRDRWAL